MKTLLNKLTIIFTITASILLINACQQSQDNKKEETEEHHEEGEKNYVSMTEEQLKIMKIKTGPLEKRNLSSMIKANGVIDLPPQNKASVSSLIGGVVTKINVIQGDFVKKGQVLVILEHPDIIRLQKDYLEAKSNFDYAEKEYQRQKQLYDEKIVSGKKFQAAEADYKSQRALISSLENQLYQIDINPQSISRGSMLRSISVKAPMEGYIHQIAVNTGSYVEPAKEIIMIVDNRHVHIDLKLYEKDVPKVKQGQKVLFTTNNAPGEEFEATIFAVGKAYDNESKSVAIHADIKGNKNKSLLPGTYVEGRIQIDSNKTDAVPNDAIVTDGNLNYIFVRTEEVHHEEHEKSEKEHKEEKEKLNFKKVQVQTGISDIGYTEITPLEELPANVQIVAAGAYYLQAEMKKGEGEDEHGH